MDRRGSSKLSNPENGGGIGLCSTTPRNLPLDPNNQIDKAVCDTANSFPRHNKSQSYSGASGSNGGDASRSKCYGGGEEGTFLGEMENFLRATEDGQTPFPPKRSTSLFIPGGASTLTLRHSKTPRECSSTLNPKRISIATSTFWLGHPDMEKFANALDFGHETMKTQSVWGTSDQGSGSGDQIDIWGDPPAVKKGVLMQQREKLWSRWKERYVILTRDYLNCFRRSANIHRSGVKLSEMGSFIFKLRLADVEEIRWENRRSGSLVALVLPQEPRILLRIPNDNTEALHQWYTLLQECIYMSKERRQALRNHHTSSTYKTYSTTKSNEEEDDDNNNGKSKSSLSPHSSSDETDAELSKPIISSRKFSSASSKTNPPGGSGSVRSSARKYSPVVVGTGDDDEYDDDYVDQIEECEEPRQRQRTGDTGGANSSSDADDYVPVQLRRSSSRGLLSTRSGSNLTLNDFVRNPWKGTTTPDSHQQPSHAEIIAQNNGSCSRRKLSSGYAIPADSLLRPNPHIQNKRPESWNPQPNLFYRTPSLVPSQWMNKRELPLSRNAGPPFGRSTMIVCPSRLTAEVTYIRRM